MRLLDLFCCEGGAAVGYARAGWDVVGVDVVNQPRYPFEFHQGDALTFPLDGFDAIHASPPCQAYSITRHTHGVSHPDLLAATRERLVASGLPYVIENVPGAPLYNPVTVCGASLGLTACDVDLTPLVLKRHRLFESNVALMVPSCMCGWFASRGYRVAGAYGGGSRDKVHAREVRKGGYTPSKAMQERLLDIDWMTLHGLAQAIPPAYTHLIGEQVAAALVNSMTPLWSWALLAILCAWGVYAAVAISHYLDDQEWREWHADLEQWRNACDALELDDIPDVGPCAEEDADT